MKVVWTEAALAELNDILAYTAEHFPSHVAAIEQRVRRVIDRIGRWPESARAVEQRPGVRVAPLVRYPYRIFYRLGDEAVEILHVQRASRDEP